MWENLSIEKRNEYRRMILAFASLTEAFAQKADEFTILSPIINSKYQETLFQKVFDASAEDIGNTSYDVAISTPDIKYLVGIKTFGIAAGDQKVAQFKANITEWSDIVRNITNNAKDKTESEINSINHSLYLELAKKISLIRNKRIDSSVANLQGFKVTKNDIVESVYHVLMPSAKNTTPSISVGETSYDKINIENITIEGCTNKNNPSNFIFSDGNHTYKYTSADSQLHMKFDNVNIVKEVWPVVYAKDAYSIFSDIANKILDEEKTLSVKQRKISESHVWPIEVFPFSGFNAFFGIGSKLAVNDRKKKIDSIVSKYTGTIDDITLDKVAKILEFFLLTPSSTSEEKHTKIILREKLLNILDCTKNTIFKEDIIKLVFRPMNELYIPVPDSKNFHRNNSNFFVRNLIDQFNSEGSFLSATADRTFNLVFDPSGESLPCYISQQWGKAIESTEKQTFLGEWILRKIFQLKEFEPLTDLKLSEIGINALKLYKYEDSQDIHIQFIWVD